MRAPDAPRRAGGCLCGAIRFQCDLLTEEIVACHCEQCRRQSGNYWAAIRAGGDTLEIDGRAALLWRRDRHTERGFCARCGSFILWRADGSPEVSVGVGALDDTTGLRLVAEIFLDEKSAHHQPIPGVEHYRRARGEPPITEERAPKGSNR